MKKSFLMLYFAALFAGCTPNPQTTQNTKIDPKEKEIKVVLSREDTIVAMANAFCKQESRFNNSATSPCGRYVGCLQISPIMVAEANRILGTECFYTYDRYDRQGSYAIFKVVQQHHNKALHIDRAIDIWNKKAPKKYRDNIKRYYAENLTAIKNDTLTDYFQILN